MQGDHAARPSAFDTGAAHERPRQAFVDEVIDAWDREAPIFESGLRAPPFELSRALSARRSIRQIRALGSEGEADGLLGFLPAGFSGSYSFPTADLIDSR